MKLRLTTLALLAALAACGQRSEQELLASAQKHMAQKDVASAVIELKNLLQKSPDSTAGRQWLGKALLESGDLAGAEIELRRAWELGAPRDEVAPLLAQALLGTGQSRKLISEFADQSLADPQAMATLQRHLAMAFLTQRNLTEAKAAAGRALQLAPQSEDAVIVSARVKLASGMPEEALAQLDDVLAHNPKAGKALLLKGELLLSNGKESEAEPLLTQALALDPEAAEPRALLVRMALARQQTDVAAKLVEGMSPALAKRPQGRLMQAQLALAQGDATKARDLSLPLLKPMPNYLPLLRLAAGAHQQLGELAEAENLLNQAVKLAPNDLALRRQYAGLLVQRRATGKALDTLAPILEGGHADAETLLLAGKAQLMQGNFEAADQAFGAAAKQRPNDPKTEAALALSAIARDSLKPGAASKAKADAALNQLRDIAAKDSGSSYDMMVVSVLLNRRELPAALAAIDKLAPKMPGSPVPDGLRGRIQLVNKNLPAAQSAFEAALKTDAGYLPAVLGLTLVDLQSKRGDAAIKRLEAFVKSQKHAPQARLALAEALAQTGAPPERIGEVLSAGVREEPTDVALRIALIDLRLRVGDKAGASQAAVEAAAALPQNVELVERLARTQLINDDRAQAGKTYTQLTVMAPKRALGWLGLAQLRFMEQDYAGTERELKRALEAEPDSQVARRLLIQVAVKQGRVDQALAMLHERQKQLPQEAFGYIAESDVEMGRQRWDASIAALRKALPLADPGDAPQRLFALLLAAKKPDEAFAFESKWMAAHGQDEGFAAAVADVLLARGELNGALQRYEALLQKQPDAVGLLNNVAWLRSKVGKPGARELAERGLKIKPDDYALRDTYATVLAADKQYAQAIDVQRKLVKDAPSRPMYRFGLAQILIQSGDKSAARKELEALVVLGDKFPRQKQVQELLKTL